MTVCGKYKYKNEIGFKNVARLTERQYQEATLSKSDVFTNVTQVETLWNVTELRSYEYGRCFTLQFRYPVSAMDLIPSFVTRYIKLCIVKHSYLNSNDIIKAQSTT